MKLPALRVPRALFSRHSWVKGWHRWTGLDQAVIANFQHRDINEKICSRYKTKNSQRNQRNESKRTRKCQNETYFKKQYHKSDTWATTSHKQRSKSIFRCYQVHSTNTTKGNFFTTNSSGRTKEVVVVIFLVLLSSLKLRCINFLLLRFNANLLHPFYFPGAFSVFSEKWSIFTNYFEIYFGLIQSITTGWFKLREAAGHIFVVISFTLSTASSSVCFWRQF